MWGSSNVAAGNDVAIDGDSWWPSGGGDADGFSYRQRITMFVVLFGISCFFFFLVSLFCVL